MKLFRIQLLPPCLMRKQESSVEVESHPGCTHRDIGSTSWRQQELQTLSSFVTSAGSFRGPPGPGFAGCSAFSERQQSSTRAESKQYLVSPVLFKTLQQKQQKGLYARFSGVAVPSTAYPPELPLMATDSLHQDTRCRSQQVTAGRVAKEWESDL